MLRQIVITFFATTAVSVLTCLVYTKYFHRCDYSPDVGDELRRMAAGWRYVAAEHKREMDARLGDPAAYAEHQAYWLAYEGCARRLDALLKSAEGGAVAAESDVPEGGAVTESRRGWLPLPRLATDTPVVRLSPPPPPPPSEDIWPSG